MMRGRNFVREYSDRYGEPPVDFIDAVRGLLGLDPLPFVSRTHRSRAENARLPECLDDSAQRAQDGQDSANLT